MPHTPHRSGPARRSALTRGDLPDEFTPDTLRHLGLRTLRELSRPHNGVLEPDEQRRFDEALAQVTKETNSLLEESIRRANIGSPGTLDPAMRRSYARAQQRLAEQARRARDSFPHLDTTTAEEPGQAASEDRANTNAPAAENEETPHDTFASGGSSAVDAAADDTTSTNDDVTPNSLEEQIEHTSDTLDMLERIASLQQQQLEHQHTQVLSETRGFFFAFLVSVAVIIAGVAPLVTASPRERIITLIWTCAATAVAGIVYAAVRAVQRKRITKHPSD